MNECLTVLYANLAMNSCVFIAETTATCIQSWGWAVHPYCNAEVNSAFYPSWER